MNPIVPSAALTPIDQVAPATPTTRVQPPTAADPASAVSTTVETIPSSPPADVLDAMGAASNRFDQLAAENKHVGLALADNGGRVQVQVSDLQGNVTSPPLAPSSIFDILDGKA
jgi:hypothetical protein